MPKLQALEIQSPLGATEDKNVCNNDFTWFEYHAHEFEIAKIDLSVSTAYCLHTIGMVLATRFLPKESRSKILGECVNMNKVLAFGLTEPKTGSDAASIQTKAKKVDGGYLLNGEKFWIGNGGFADYVIVFAKNEAAKGDI